MKSAVLFPFSRRLACFVVPSLLVAAGGRAVYFRVFRSSKHLLRPSARVQKGLQAKGRTKRIFVVSQSYPQKVNVQTGVYFDAVRGR